MDKTSDKNKKEKSEISFDEPSNKALYKYFKRIIFLFID